MNRFSFIFHTVSMLIALLYLGCGSSQESTQKQENRPPINATKSAEQPVKDGVNKIDTLNVNIQDAQKPTYEQSTKQPTMRYSVQVGAYKLADNADRVATLARERFGKIVYTIPDKASDLYKVMVGDFAVKDEARKFRDEMVQKYPSDYKDAWVSEISQK